MTGGLSPSVGLGIQLVGADKSVEGDDINVGEKKGG